MRRGVSGVLEAVDYRNFNNPPETHRSRPEGERIVILEDTDGDGQADTSKTCVQDEDLVWRLHPIDAIEAHQRRVVAGLPPHQ